MDAYEISEFRNFVKLYVLALKVSCALRCCGPGGTLSSLRVYSSDLEIPLDAFLAGLGDHRIVTTLRPGGKERMRRLMEVIGLGRWIRSRWSRIASDWTRSSKPTNSSRTIATVC
jgi:hypothetical protein